LFKPLSRRSLPQHLAFAVAKAVGATVALLLGYLGTAVASDMSHLAEGRRVSGRSLARRRFLLAG